MIQIHLLNYALSNVCLNMVRSYFKFILMLDQDINLNPGAITTIKVAFRMTSLFTTVYQFNIGSNKSDSGDKGNMFKNKEIHFIHLNVNRI